MNLNEYGNIVRDAWLKIPDHYDVLLNAFIVMPNHVHGIVRLKDYVGTGHALSAKPGNHINLSTVIGSFKAAASRKINLRNEIFFRWQRSFYDHIIMSESELNSIIKYINNNPWNWEIDQKRIDNLLI